MSTVKHLATKEDKIELIEHMDKRFRQTVLILLLSIAVMAFALTL